jgi:hypothetical protein
MTMPSVTRRFNKTTVSSFYYLSDVSCPLQNSVNGWKTTDLTGKMGCPEL